MYLKYLVLTGSFWFAVGRLVGGEAFGYQVGDAVAVFEDAVDGEAGVAAGYVTVSVPGLGCYDYVESAGFVFEVDEDDAFGGSGTLPVGDDPSHFDANPVSFQVESVGDGEASLCCWPGSGVVCGVLCRHSGRP